MNAPCLPLLTHASAESIIARRADGVVTLRQFLDEARQLSGQFPPGASLINLCKDRYRFSVGLAAAILAGKTSLLPSSHTPENLRQIRNSGTGVFCLTDSDPVSADLQQVRYPDMKTNLAYRFAIPQIEAGQRVAEIFTSGSTGNPQPHAKTWGALAGSVRSEAARVGILPGSGCTLVGTVPPQHMYGFESTVLLAWQSGNAFSHAQPFYPADICQALSAVPMPRVLVSTPVHLRALLAAELELPEISGVVCATAPLSAQLAGDVEARCNAPLMEIYGSTETGQIASRRTTQTAHWQLFPGVVLSAQGDSMCASGANIDTPTLMNDVLESVTDELFILHNRKADLVNIAGKRHSLASLNHLLNSIPGVVDGAFFMPDETSEAHVTRLAACVVAPGVETAYLRTALRERIDPVFLPRPLIRVETLPRNHTGKLPHSALQALLQLPDGQKSI